jgi:1,2-dihydroxy-3-keto-5-methylthiopentene dioxygenase
MTGISMSTLTIYDESANLINHTENAAEISELLNQAGIVFKRWPAKHAIQADMTSEQILAIYKEEIDNFVEEGGYLSVDSISMHPQHPDKIALREKFLSEHTHSEDEIRFFVKGQGLFILHIADKVYAVLCCQNDLISVPAGVPHWFDMSANPEFTAIRFFNNTEGWVAKYTGSDIAEHFPLLS